METLVEGATLGAPEEKAEDIVMTNSQLLNDKGEEIVPIYKNKKYLLFFAILVLLVLSGLAVTSLRGKKPPVGRVKGERR